MIFKVQHRDNDGNGIAAAGIARYLDYCLNPKQGHPEYQGGERVLWVEGAEGLVLSDDCTGETLAEQFETLMIAARGDKKAPTTLAMIGTLSFHGHEATPEAAITMAKQAVHEVMPNRPAAFVVHGDAENIHVHFVVGSVDHDGKIFRVREDYRLWELQAERLELEYGLTRVLVRKAMSQEDARREVKERAPSSVEVQMKDRTGVVAPGMRLKQFIKDARAYGGFSEFAAALALSGVEVMPHMSGGKVGGVKFRLAGETDWTKGSSLGKEFGWNRLAAALRYDAEQHRAIIDRWIQGAAVAPAEAPAGASVRAATAGPALEGGGATDAGGATEAPRPATVPGRMMRLEDGIGYEPMYAEGALNKIQTEVRRMLQGMPMLRGSLARERERAPSSVEVQTADREGVEVVPAAQPIPSVIILGHDRRGSGLDRREPGRVRHEPDRRSGWALAKEKARQDMAKPVQVMPDLSQVTAADMRHLFRQLAAYRGALVGLGYGGGFVHAGFVHAVFPGIRTDKPADELEFRNRCVLYKNTGRRYTRDQYVQDQRTPGGVAVWWVQEILTLNATERTGEYLRHVPREFPAMAAKYIADQSAAGKWVHRGKATESPAPPDNKPRGFAPTVRIMSLDEAHTAARERAEQSGGVPVMKNDPFRVKDLEEVVYRGPKPPWG